MEQLGSQWTDCHEISYEYFRKSAEKINFNLNLTRITGTLSEHPCTFTITSPVLFKMQNVSEKGRGENQNTHFMFNNTFPKTRAIYDILWKITVEPEVTDDAIWRMCIGQLRLQIHKEYGIAIALSWQE
jgi:hypothetical protein